MKKMLLTVVAVVGSLVAGQAQSDSAQIILDKYITAIGGRENLMKVTDLTTSMSSTTDRGTILITRKQKLPNKFSMLINANGMEVMKQTGDGEKVMMGGMQGSRTLDGAMAQQMMATNRLFPELYYTENGIKSQYVGREDVAGKETVKLSHTTADGQLTWTDNFDPKTGLKVQSVVGGRGAQNPMSATMIYSDYKATNGIQFPMTIEQQSGRGAMTMTVDAIKINKGLKDADFTVK